MSSPILSSIIPVVRKMLESSSSEDSSSEEEILFDFLEGNKNKKHMKIKNYMEEVVPKYLPTDFQSHFRLTRIIVERILEEIQLKPIRINARKPPIAASHAFLLTLWVLANQESFRGVADRFGVSRGHAHTIFIDTVKAVYKHRKRYIIFPHSLAAIRENVLRFSSLRQHHSFPNVVGCVDGTHILIPAPSGDDSYYNRKGTHSMLVQAICDADGLFIDLFCGYPGSSHDSGMWKASPVYHKLKNNTLLPEEFHLLGDSAYPLDMFLMTPYRDNGHLSRRQKNFNTVLSKTRVIVEQAFGRLKRTWRRLKYLNIENLEYYKYIVITACILHNISVKEKLDHDMNEHISYDNDMGDMHVNENNIRAQNKRDRLALELNV